MNSPIQPSFIIDFTNRASQEGYLWLILLFLVFLGSIILSNVVAGVATIMLKLVNYFYR
jgi:hypothetical protein